MVSTVRKWVEAQLGELLKILPDLTTEEVGTRLEQDLFLKIWLLDAIVKNPWKC